MHQISESNMTDTRSTPPASRFVSHAATRTAAVLAAAALGLLPALASAHVGVDGHHHPGFAMGFMHPVTGLDHLAAMLAVGLWSALSASRAWPDLLWAPLGFAGMLLVGAVLGLQGLAIPAVEPMIAASLLVIGLLAASRVHLPALASAALVGLFAVFHGVAHGYELAGEAGAFSTLAGMLCATLVLHLCGVAIGWSLRQGHALVPRAAGLAVAALGTVMLAQMA
ncbi:urease accessory protein [Comamonas sp. BIGb0124]|nr:urease accessory protein [Comamonas sp. BIGb0124]